MEFGKRPERLAVGSTRSNCILRPEGSDRAHRKLGIFTQACVPIGGVKRHWLEEGQEPQDSLRHQAITALAEKYGKTAAQIVLRWHIDFSAISKSVRPERVAENFDIFDFALTAGEVASIDALDRSGSGSGRHQAAQLQDRRLRRGGPGPHAR
ncbi:aldo/keto reductase [Rhizobium beringeri]|uniref:aldo/keto reductase n=1 Tax=Rhizobium beringeri TaxID=3019934 RepID=UPI002DDD728D|nr:aldo/keto reductase [Rhizobium beringeri]WSG91574.1 aldo/keto reductase [Rhizobium beringeri]WSH30198.1 aldo/keto reductase [Rhizobium beringeri]WSH83461.1 aldo/keto reductase [Rhizobium beringeri]